MPSTESHTFPTITEKNLADAICFLNKHHNSFKELLPFADITEHPVPVDTRAWSQIFISLLVGIRGQARKKGQDLIDNSDVKAANAWEAIDVPRFNGVIKSGTQSSVSGNMSYLDSVPNLYFVLWDNTPQTKIPRCRVWCVRPKCDLVFRSICEKWYQQRADKAIKSDNFQLHPPIGRNDDIFTNRCGNLAYPLLFVALYSSPKGYTVDYYNNNVFTEGQCVKIDKQHAD